MRTTLFPLLLVLSFSVTAQPPYRHETTNYLDQDGNRTEKIKKAVLLVQIAQLNDTLWEINYYQIDGPRTMSVRTPTADGRIFNGNYITYSRSGWADTIGYYSQGKRNEFWTLFNGARSTSTIYYRNDSIIWQKDSLQFSRYWDSIKAATGMGSDTPQVQSVYPGGGAGWLKYLNKNLRYPNDAFKKSIRGQVVVGFVVDEDGKVPPASLWLQRSVAYSLDMEAMRVIVQSDNWDPALKDGKKVWSFKKQPVTFRF